MAYVLLLEELLPKNSFLFSIQQETFFYFYFFNLIFPANMDLQGLQLTAWGWEEVSPQAKSFWSISFVGILAASSQEDCNHCQRHNTRPKWPFKMTKCDIPCVHRSGGMGGDSQICFSADRQQFLLCCGGCSWGEHDFGMVGEKVIRCLNSWLPTWENESGAEPPWATGSHLGADPCWTTGSCGQLESWKGFEGAAWAEHCSHPYVHTHKSSQSRARL